MMGLLRLQRNQAGVIVDGRGGGLRVVAFFLGMILLCAPRSSCQTPPGSIAYNKINSQGYLELWAIQGDGTGDTMLPAPAQSAYPVWSWDGLSLAVSGPDRPNVYSWNVFVEDPGTGNTQEVTGFYDYVDPARGSIVTMPLYKAFSPDAQKIAVSAYEQVVGTGHPTTTAFLWIYGVDGTQQALVAIGADTSVFASGSHEGDGIDWAPNQDLLVYPLLVPAPPLTPSPTAIYTMSPSPNGRGRQLTTPTAYRDFTGTYSQRDFQPVFSPDGTQVAYIRTFQQFVLPSRCVPFSTPSTPSIRIVNIDGSNDHEVARFQQGNYIARISWSPDASELVINGGAEAIDPLGCPSGLPNYNTLGLHTINVDGSGFQHIQVAPTLFASWNPTGAMRP